MATFKLSVSLDNAAFYDGDWMEHGSVFAPERELARILRDVAERVEGWGYYGTSTMLVKPA